MCVPLSVAVDSCVTKTYFATYPHPTAFTFYAASTEDEPRYTFQTNVRKVLHFEIPMPELPDVKRGDPVQMDIKMYFGEIELRVEAVIREKTYEVKCDFNP